MSSRVETTYRYWFLNLGKESQGEMSREYSGCSNSSLPQRRSSCHTHSALCGLALLSELFTAPLLRFRTNKMGLESLMVMVTNSWLVCTGSNSGATEEPSWKRVDAS
ncbi:hypothetical protein TNCV_1551251 [Trichonephila clavipes]|nr:hypothetical protein TNCV_1551251 [Trichonephila clavipes]